MIVVTGATGNVGRPLVESLVRSGHAVTAVSRGVTSPPPSLPGVTARTADLADAASLTLALAGAKALYLLVSGAGAHVDGAAVLRRAADAGVERVVLQSSQAAGTRPDAVSHATLAALEEQVRSSGMAWTILRPGGFATNAFAWAPSIRGQRTVFAPFADVALPAVDPLDIAGVAAAALTGDVHTGRTYTLTGPEATSPRRRTEILADVLGDELALVELGPDEARERLLQVMPEPVADGTLAVLGRPTPDELRVSPDVEDVLGRPATSFATWARRNVDVFR
ncbi:NmrA family transcriptional regulator [Luteimicrobium album]|uniref:NmrA family transcriptional regulator n=1 Tax=Luteimicrobium album TaxID=1054550 RepID=A0ABQ6I248_9MICO|nr:NAD(P)H-binding protein [Luteimicrobium album]GMA24302.1 NmrA family transcriptional regulator [Luteimicrobium album]